MGGGRTANPEAVEWDQEVGDMDEDEMISRGKEVFEE
jgi:hypothetical protein